MFLTEKRKIYIQNIIKDRLLSNLNTTEFDQLIEIYFKLLEDIYIKLLIDAKEDELFFDQLKRNKDRDIIAILFLLLPYINDSNNYEKFKMIRELSDITTKKQGKDYIISNFQYSRGYLDTENEKFQEYKYSIQDILINFELLKQSDRKSVV